MGEIARVQAQAVGNIPVGELGQGNNLLDTELVTRERARLIETERRHVRHRFDSVDALHQRLFAADADRANCQRQDGGQDQSLRHDAGDKDHRVADRGQRNDGAMLQVAGDKDHRRADHHNHNRQPDNQVEAFLGGREDVLVLLGEIRQLVDGAVFADHCRHHQAAPGDAE